MTQHERLLMMFEEKPTWSNYELRSINPPMFQYITRLYELKHKGYNIVTSRDANDNKKFYYTLHKSQKDDLFEDLPPLQNKIPSESSQQ